MRNPFKCIMIGKVEFTARHQDNVILHSETDKIVIRDQPPKKKI